MSAIVAFFIGYHMNKSVAIQIDQRPISDRDGISQKEDQVRVNAKETLGRPVAREKVGTAKMSVDEALKKIQAFNLKHESINERASFATEIVEKLCANGQISEAWQVIDPASGSVRTRQIYAFFRNAGLDVKQLTEYCSSFVDSFDVSVSAGAFFSNKSLAQIANLRKEPGFDDLEKIIGKHSNANFNVSKQIKYALENLAEKVSHKEKAEVALHLCKDKILKVKIHLGFMNRSKRMF
jgi:hypothetical protein